MFPIHYGIGHMHIPIGGLTAFFREKGELIGHSGSSGSLAFYYPQKDLFFVGNFNQLSSPAIPIQTAIRLAVALKGRGIIRY